MKKQVATKAGATHSVVYFAARGRGDATDMLRYDSCVPADEGQSLKLKAAFVDPLAEPAWVIFRRFVAAGQVLAPTVDRWLRYGWEVLKSGTAYGAWYTGATCFDSVREVEETATAHDAWQVKEAAKRLGAP